MILLANNVTAIGEMIFSNSFSMAGTAEFLGLLVVLGFILFVFMSKIGMSATTTIGTFLLLALRQSGLINDTIFYLAILIMAYFVAKAYTDYGKGREKVE